MMISQCRSIKCSSSSSSAAFFCTGGGFSKKLLSSSFGYQHYYQHKKQKSVRNKGISTFKRYSNTVNSNAANVDNWQETGTSTTTQELLDQNTNIDWNKPFFPIYYNDVYEVDLPPNHRFPMAKYRQVREKVQENFSQLSESDQSRIHCDFRVSPLVTIKDLITTHDQSYVERFLKGNLTEIEVRNVGFPWSLQGVDRALSSVGGTVAAAASICDTKKRFIKVHSNDDEISSSSFCWAAHVAGGTHHAFIDRGEGFCVFSDIAVAANVILQKYPDIVKRILIIDLDVHQGNGNAVLFDGRDDVFTFSMHCSSNYFSKKEESDLDIELPAGCGDETYLSTLSHWLKRIENEAGDFDFIFFQAGVDILDDDRLGQMSLSLRGVEQRNDLVFQFAQKMNVPLCMTMGGGYPRKDWAPILDAHSNVYFQAIQFLLKVSD